MKMLGNSRSRRGVAWPRLAGAGRGLSCPSLAWAALAWPWPWPWPWPWRIALALALGWPRGAKNDELPMTPRSPRARDGAGGSAAPINLGVGAGPEAGRGRRRGEMDGFVIFRPEFGLGPRAAFRLRAALGPGCGPGGETFGCWVLGIGVLGYGYGYGHWAGSVFEPCHRAVRAGPGSWASGASGSGAAGLPAPGPRGFGAEEPTAFFWWAPWLLGSGLLGSLLLFL